MTVDEYLRYEQSSEQKHEYVSGYVFAMTGARQAHEIVCGNLFSLVRTHLRGSGCRAFQSNMKVKIATADIFYYPDLVVTCEPYEPESVMVQKPCLIGEVHSPSTKHIDRREKLVAYTQIESLREYLMVSPNKYRIELVRKNADGEWESTVYGKDDIVTLNSMPEPLEIPVSEFYADIQLTPMVEESDEDDEYLPPPHRLQPPDK